MSRVLVIAHLNHDRIWQLDGPLKSGSRVSWRERGVRLGGGGYFTGSRFLELGHEVALVSSLSNDVNGAEAWEHLSQTGFDMQHVTRRDTPTLMTEILLEPSGERTILAPHSGPSRLFTLENEARANAAYINCFNPDGNIVNALNLTGFVASQFPISETAVARPADLVIGSRGDFPGLDDAQLWQKASNFCGARLKHVVMTDGARPISILDGRSIQTVPTTKRAKVKDTIGAGDHFCASLISAMFQGMMVEDATVAANKETAEWLEQRDHDQQENSNLQWLIIDR